MKIIKENKKFWYILLGFILATVAITFVSHTYNDILITTRHGLNLWGNIFDGNLKEYFVLSSTVSGNMFYQVEQTAAYNILVYVIFAVWNLPLLFAETYFNVDIMNVQSALLWMKMLPIVFFAMSAFVFNKIAIILIENKRLRKLAIFLYCTSILMISPIMINCQYDSIGLVFVLLGLLAFLKGNNKKFIFYFALALCFKLFAVFVFFPLLLIKEKRLIYIIRDSIIVISLLVFTTVFFTPLIETSLSLNMLYKALLPETNNYSLFIISLVLICIYCYIYKKTCIVHRNNTAIWAVFIASCSFYLFTNINPYWIILILPYFILMICSDANKVRNNILMEIVMSCSIIINQMLVYHWCFSEQTMLSMSVSNISPAALNDSIAISEGAISQIFTAISMGASSFFPSVTIGVFIAFVIYNFPRNINAKQKVKLEIDYPLKEMLVFRTIAFCTIALIPILKIYI